MGRLIDSSSINNCVMMHKSDWGIFATDIDNIIGSIVMECSTVEAIPKADYENRLRADMVAMLEELKEEFKELKSYGSADGQDLVMLADIGILFQQKIDKIKGL